MSEQIISLSQFRSSATQLLNDIHKSGTLLVLTQNGSATAVVQDIETYQAQKNALVMLKLLAQGEADVREGRVQSQEQVFADLEAELLNAE